MGLLEYVLRPPAPAIRTAFLMFLAANTLSAIFNIITDCDEVIAFPSANVAAG
jgi:hypothetical protein